MTKWFVVLCALASGCATTKTQPITKEPTAQETKLAYCKELAAMTFSQRTKIDGAVLDDLECKSSIHTAGGPTLVPDRVYRFEVR